MSAAMPWWATAAASLRRLGRALGTPPRLRLHPAQTPVGDAERDVWTAEVEGLGWLRLRGASWADRPGASRRWSWRLGPAPTRVHWPATATLELHSLGVFGMQRREIVVAQRPGVLDLPPPPAPVAALLQAPPTFAPAWITATTALLRTLRWPALPRLPRTDAAGFRLRLAPPRPLCPAASVTLAGRVHLPGPRDPDRAAAAQAFEHATIPAKEHLP